MAAPNNFDISGYLKNCLHVGVSLQNAVLEKMDNSLSAGSTEIVQHVPEDKYVFILADDGHGMNADMLEKSCCLHGRTVSSSDHHGRFGFGGKQAEITLTNLEGTVTKLSSDGNEISQITINYPKIVEKGIYYPQAHGIVSGGPQHMWDECAINPSGAGTVICSHLSEKNREELIKLCTDMTVSGFRFELATTYRDALEKGVKISMKIGDFQYQIHPFDRLCSSWCGTLLPPIIQFKHKSHDIDILQNTITGETVAYVISADGGHMRFDQSKKCWIHVAALLDSDKIIGRVKFQLAYSNNWNHLQKDDLEKNGITPLSKGQTGVGAQRHKTNGKELVRNGKITKHFEPKYKNVQNALKEFHSETRERIAFDANTQMDEVFNVQVNKSHVNEDLIHSNVWKIFDRLRQTFIMECQKTFMSAPSKSRSKCVKMGSLTEEEYLAQLPLAQLPLAQLPLAQLPLVYSQSISNSETYDSDDGSHDASSDDDEEAIDEMTDIVPDSVRAVGPSVHQRITCAKGKNIMEHWRNSGEHQATFDKTIVDMIISYQDRSAQDQIQDMLKGLMPSIEAKYNCIMYLIQKRHPLPEDDMFKGIELLRTYRDAFGTNAVVHL